MGRQRQTAERILHKAKSGLTSDVTMKNDQAITKGLKNEWTCAA